MPVLVIISFVLFFHSAHAMSALKAAAASAGAMPRLQADRTALRFLIVPGRLQNTGQFDIIYQVM
jgi:hypothetical protein